MSIGLPKILYNPGSGNVTLQFKLGPTNFTPYWDGRVHNNLATSGKVQERVTENLDILMSFDMPNMVIEDDMPAWMSFLAWALLGGTFSFYPNSALADNYNCVMEDSGWQAKRNAPKKYGSSIVMRILQDGSCPSDPGVVLRRFYGVTS